MYQSLAHSLMPLLHDQGILHHSSVLTLHVQIQVAEQERMESSGWYFLTISVLWVPFNICRWVRGSASVPYKLFQVSPKVLFCQTGSQIRLTHERKPVLQELKALNRISSAISYGIMHNVHTNSPLFQEKMRQKGTNVGGKGEGDDGDNKKHCGLSYSTPNLLSTLLNALCSASPCEVT